MPKDLKRYYGHGHLHFITFSCYRRLPLLSTTGARNVFVEALGEIRERYEFSLVGYVVMPNHVHLLISESAEDTPSVALKVLKQRVHGIFEKVPARVCRASGSLGSTISMSGVKRKFARNSITCTRIRLQKN